MSGSIGHSSSGMQAPPFAVSNFLNSLECPVMFTPLSDAVILVPCGHTISEIAAKQIYGGMSGEGGTETVRNPAACPLGCRKVTAYYPNLIVRSLIGEVSSVKLEEALPLFSAALPGDDKINIDDIPFPGKGAKFVLSANHWNAHYGTGGDLVRELEFKSQTSGSLFTKFSVLGYRDGSFAIFFNFEKKCKDAAIDYLSKCGIELKFIEREICHYKSDLSTTELVFRILAKHNDIPQDQFTLIRELVNSDDWRKVTPFEEATPVTDDRRAYFDMLF